MPVNPTLQESAWTGPTSDSVGSPSAGDTWSSFAAFQKWPLEKLREHCVSVELLIYCLLVDLAPWNESFKAPPKIKHSRSNLTSWRWTQDELLNLTHLIHSCFHVKSDWVSVTLFQCRWDVDIVYSEDSPDVQIKCIRLLSSYHLFTVCE